jgi:hypothetical protein
VTARTNRYNTIMTGSPTGAQSHVSKEAVMSTAVEHSFLAGVTEVSAIVLFGSLGIYMIGINY